VITGTVTAIREAVLILPVYDANGQAQSGITIVDTGFTGWLTLPPNRIAALGLAWKRSAHAILADGNTILTNVYEDLIEWDGQSLPVPVVEADADSLVGMSLMYGYELVMPIVDGGIFTLRHMSNP
jgi:predicted aspartyl protease